MSKKKNIVWLQSWEESESSWGQTPDGCSLHLTELAAKKYVDNFLKSQRKRLGEATPKVYERPCGKPYRVVVNEKTLTEIRNARPRHSRRFTDKDRPKPAIPTYH